MFSIFWFWLILTSLEYNFSLVFIWLFRLKNPYPISFLEETNKKLFSWASLPISITKNSLLGELNSPIDLS